MEAHRYSSTPVSHRSINVIGYLDRFKTANAMDKCKRFLSPNMEQIGMLNPCPGLISRWSHTRPPVFCGNCCTWRQAFRPDEDVDINAMDDNNYNVGYITAGEFLRYTINATKKSEIHQNIGFGFSDAISTKNNYYASVVDVFVQLWYQCGTEDSSVAFISPS